MDVVTAQRLKCWQWFLILGAGLCLARDTTRAEAAVPEANLRVATRASTKPASVADYQIASWGLSQGLPDSAVLALAQTPDGYIWCGTEAGLARFDGTRFITFDGYNTPELGNDQIQSLFTDRQGTLWISTRNNRLVRFRDGAFTSYTPPQRPTLELAILNLADDDEGGLWLMTKDRKSLLRFVNGQFQPATGLWPGGPESFNIRSGFDTDAWLMSGDTLVHRVHGVIKTVLKQPPGECWFHAPSRTGGFWVSTAECMGLYTTNGWLWRNEKHPTNVVEFLRGPLQWGVEDNQQRLWLASAGDGAYCFDTNGNALHFTASQGLAGNRARFILADREDAIWVGTDNGLSRIRPALFHVLDERQGLKADRITGVFPAPDGGLWVGTDGGGLNRLQEDKVVPSIAIPAHDKITAVLVDSSTNTWVGTHGGGLFHSTPRGFSRLSGMRLTDEISALFEDSSHRIWVGQRSLNIISRIGPGNVGRPIVVPHPEPIIDVRCFAEDGAKNIWAGTRGSGLFRWDGTQFTCFTRTNGLPSNLITTLHFDAEEQSLWIGTGGGGLVRWKDGQFTVCDAGRGLWNNTICQMLDDGRGWFWFGSQRGIFRVSKATLRDFMDGDLPRIHSIAYGVEDGLPTPWCSDGFQPAGCRSPDGRLWFPAVGGLVWVDPAAVPVSSHPPVVEIIKVLLNGEESREVLARNGATPDAPAFALPRAVQRCEFQYTGLSLEDPQSVQFKYRMEGLDRDWVEAGTARSATYSKLPPGDYRFVVTAANRDGVWNETGAALRFRVPPAFWQTGWFLATCVSAATVSLVGTGWFAARRRARRRLAEIAQANALERERTRIARDMHDELGARLTGIANMGELAMNANSLPIEIKSQIGCMTGRVRELINTVDEVVWTVSPENDSLPDLIAFLCDYTERFVAPTGISHRLELDPEFPALRLTAEGRHHLLLAFKEALNNAVRHAAASRIHVKIHARDGWLKVEVSDDGQGFEVAKGRTGGHGLANLGERMRLVNGSTEIHSASGKGTTVTLSMPLSARSGAAPAASRI